MFPEVSLTAYVESMMVRSLFITRGMCCITDTFYR